MPLSWSRLLPARSQRGIAHLASKRVGIMKIPPESQKKGLGAPLDDGQKRQSVICARTLPSQFLIKRVFFPKKSENGPCGPL